MWTQKGGYGTKIMDAIASELPDSAWKMSALPNKQVRVTLSWCLSQVDLAKEIHLHQN